MRHINCDLRIVNGNRVALFTISPGKAVCGKVSPTERH